MKSVNFVISYYDYVPTMRTENLPVMVETSGNSLLTEKEKSLLELMTGSVSISDLIPPAVPGWESFLKKRADQNGLSKLDLYPMQADDWLRVDASYDAQISLKKKILDNHFETACRLLDGSEQAGRELLLKVAEFLSIKFSNRFSFDGSIFKDLSREKQICFDGVSGIQALRYAGHIAQEDFVLVKIEDGVPRCVGACLCFPSHWEIGDKIGKTMMEVHAPVVPLNTMIGNQIDKFLSGLRPWKPMERTSGTITPYNILPFFASLSSYASRLTGTDVNDKGGLKPEKFTLKNERQTFMRLEKSNYLVFGIKVYMSSFAELPANVAAHLHAMLLTTPQKFIKDYKNWSDEKFKNILGYLANKANLK